jgi:hypothetical protein
MRIALPVPSQQLETAGTVPDLEETRKFALTDDVVPASPTFGGSTSANVCARLSIVSEAGADSGQSETDVPKYINYLIDSET